MLAVPLKNAKPKIVLLMARLANVGAMSKASDLHSKSGIANPLTKEGDHGTNLNAPILAQRKALHKQVEGRSRIHEVAMLLCPGTYSGHRKINCLSVSLPEPAVYIWLFFLLAVMRGGRVVRKRQARERAT